MATTKVTTPVTGFESGVDVGLKIPTGTNSDIPTGVEGMIRNDTEENSGGTGSTTAITFYNGTQWRYFTSTESPDVPYVESFKTVLYTGNGTTNQITGVGFQPDLVWVKRRSAAANHYIVDTVRGNGSSTYKNLTSNNTDTDGTTTSSGITNNTIVDGGFTMQGTGARTNANNDTYVAWCFKAGGAPSGSDKVSIDGTSYATMTEAGLTDGTEPIDKLSVNTKLGFSIVKYTAPALRVDTVAHGLGETPEMIILKSTSVARNWNVFHKDVGITKNLHLNTTDAANTGEDWTVNSSTFSIQDYSASADWIAYCFASKRGVSKVGSFIGTGTSGNKIYTGFEPAFIITKRSSSSGANWTIIDNKRSTDSDKNDYLAADTINQEAPSGSGITFNRDGFTFNGGSFNTSGQTHIYYAVAKSTNETELATTSDEVWSGFQNAVTSITSDSTDAAKAPAAADTATTSSIFDTTKQFGMGDNGSSEASNEIFITLNAPKSITGFAVYEMYQSGYRYTGTTKLYGSTDNSNWYLLGSTVQNTNIQYNRNETTFTATPEYQYYKFTLSANTRTTYQGAFAFELIAPFDVTPSLHLDADSFDGSTNTPTTWTALTGSNGTITGATFDSELGNFLNFDGSGDSVSVPHDVAFNSSTNISFEVWVNRDGTTEDTIISKGTGASTNYFFIYNPSNGYYYYNYVSGGGVKTGTSGLSTGKWEHVVLSIDGSGNKKIYVNGEDKSTAIGSVGTTDTTDTGALNIGGANGYTATALAGFGGKIGQFRIYGSALTQDQVRQNFNFTKNDYPNGYNGTISGATFNPNGYFDFDGSGDSINLGSDLKFTINSSIALWINPDNKGGNRAVISKWQGSSPYGWILNQQNNGNLEFFFYSGSSFKIVNVGVVSTDSWSHIVITYDGENLKAYLNDTLANTTSNINSLVPNDNSTNVLLCSAAISGITTQQFNGKISDVKMFDKALTSAEVTAQFAIKQFDIG